MYFEKHKNEIYIEITKKLIKNIAIQKPIILRADKYILRKYNKYFENKINKTLGDFKDKSEIHHVASEKYLESNF
ncbi:MAG: hypothetical protein FWH29_02050 [Methanobrevibacter sp.]|nr:hypothetical protein [Methanobrevibacter sp.]